MAGHGGMLEIIISNYCLIPGHAGETCEQSFSWEQQTEQLCPVRTKEEYRGSHSQEKTKARRSQTEVQTASILSQNIWLLWRRSDERDPTL